MRWAGGCLVAACADYRVIVKDATIGLPEVRPAANEVAMYEEECRCTWAWWRLCTCGR